MCQGRLEFSERMNFIQNELNRIGICLALAFLVHNLFQCIVTTRHSQTRIQKFRLQALVAWKLKKKAQRYNSHIILSFQIYYILCSMSKWE